MYFHMHNRTEPYMFLTMGVRTFYIFKKYIGKKTSINEIFVEEMSWLTTDKPFLIEKFSKICFFFFKELI